MRLSWWCFRLSLSLSLFLTHFSAKTVYKDSPAVNLYEEAAVKRVLFPRTTFMPWCSQKERGWSKSLWTFTSNASMAHECHATQQHHDSFHDSWIHRPFQEKDSDVPAFFLEEVYAKEFREDRAISCVWLLCVHSLFMSVSVLASSLNPPQHESRI